jgi:hypothetical protein
MEMFLFREQTMIADKHPTFRYDDAKHEYWLGRNKLPHWTEIYRPYWELEAKKINQDVLSEKRDWGDISHKYLEAYNRGTLDLGAIPDGIIENKYNIKALMINWDRECSDNLYVASSVEYPTFSRKYLYGTKIDLTIGNGVHEFKSRPPQDKDGVQLAGQAQAAFEDGLISNLDNVLLISHHFDKMGNFTHHKKWDFKENINFFFSLLTLYNKFIGAK